MSVPMEALGVAAPPPWSERAWQGTLTAALASLGFFVPFSTAGTYVSMTFLLLLALLAPARVWKLTPWREPVMAVGLALLAYIAARTFAASGFSARSVSAVNHYHELLMVPILWALFRLARRPNAFINGLIAGALLLTALHWLAPLNEAVWWFVHARRISVGFILPVCAFLFFEHARLRRIPSARGYAASAAIALTVLFGSNGRTGHVLLLFLVACAAFRAAPPKWRLGVTGAAILAAVLTASMSADVRGRFMETVHGTTRLFNGAPADTSSTSIRLQLLRVGVAVAGDHLAVGTGWEDYQRVFEQTALEQRMDQSVMEVGAGPLNNPHMEYVLQLGAGGFPALLLFLAWLAAPAWYLWSHRGRASPWAGAVAAISAAFAVTALFNSTLMDFVEAHVYGTLLAWLLVRRVDP